MRGSMTQSQLLVASFGINRSSLARQPDWKEHNHGPAYGELAFTVPLFDELKWRAVQKLKQAPAQVGEGCAIPYPSAR
jgi:hypothetical protein